MDGTARTWYPEQTTQPAAFHNAAGQLPDQGSFMAPGPAHLSGNGQHHQASYPPAGYPAGASPADANPVGGYPADPPSHAGYLPGGYPAAPHEPAAHATQDPYAQDGYGAYPSYRALDG